MNKIFLIIAAAGVALIAAYFLLQAKPTYYCADPADMERCRYSMYNCVNSLLILDLPPVVMNFDITKASFSTCHIIVEIKGLLMTCDVAMDKVRKFWDDPNEIFQQCKGPLLESMFVNMMNQTGNLPPVNQTG